MNVALCRGAGLLPPRLEFSFELQSKRNPKKSLPVFRQHG